MGGNFVSFEAQRGVSASINLITPLKFNKVFVYTDMKVINLRHQCVAIKTITLQTFRNVRINRNNR